MEDARLEFQQCMEDQGIELPEMTRGADDIGVHVEVFEEGDGNPTPPPIDIEEIRGRAEDCQSVYDEYPELEDVFGEGGMAVRWSRGAEADEP